MIITIINNCRCHIQTHFHLYLHVKFVMSLNQLHCSAMQCNRYMHITNDKHCFKLFHFPDYHMSIDNPFYLSVSNYFSFHCVILENCLVRKNTFFLLTDVYGITFTTLSYPSPVGLTHPPKKIVRVFLMNFCKSKDSKEKFVIYFVLVSSPPHLEDFKSEDVETFPLLNILFIQ